jgi:hypothetical protein
MVVKRAHLFHVVVIVFALLAVVAPISAQSPATLTLSDLTLDVNASGTLTAALTCDPLCGVAQMTFTFDPAIVRVDAITLGGVFGNPALGQVSAPVTRIDPDGSVTIAVLAATREITPVDNTLFTLAITGVAQGNTQLLPSSISLGGAVGQRVNFVSVGGLITVGTPPPPATEVPPPTATLAIPATLELTATVQPTVGTEPTAIIEATPALELTAVVAATATLEVRPDTGICFVTTPNSDVGIHVGPSFNRTVRTSLRPNVQVVVTGQTNDENGNVWYRIQPEGVTTELDRYWVAASLVQTVGDCTNVPPAEGSQIINTGGGTGGSLSFSFIGSGLTEFTHTVTLDRAGSWTVSCAGNPIYPEFIFNGQRSNGQTAVTIQANAGRVPLVVRATTINRQGNVAGIDNYNCTLTFNG